MSTRIILRRTKLPIRVITMAAILLTCLNPNVTLAKDIVVAHPKNVKVEFENAQVRVIRITLGPHQKMALHETREGVNIPLRNYVIVHKDAAGNAKEFQRVAGQPEWIPAGERTVESGDQPVEAILVEIKTPAASNK